MSAARTVTAMEFDQPSPPLPDAAYFEPPTPHRVGDREGEWWRPTEYARGPWSPDALHGGPPTAVLARALEHAVPNIRLARITVDLLRPVPMAGFAIVTEIVRPGRQIAATRATLVTADGTVCAIAGGLHLATVGEPLLDSTADNSGITLPRLADSAPGTFVIGGAHDGSIMFRDSVSMRFPPGESPDPGATACWMRSLAIVADEQPSPFQRICPLADCSNAFSRHGELVAGGLSFINPDLTIALHRDPIGEWAGMHSSSQWQPSGVGLATSRLYDDHGSIGMAMQTLLLRPL